MKDKIFQAIDWLMYFVLLCIALYFIVKSEVLDTFSQKWTDFHNHEDDHSNKTQPSLMACIKQDNFMSLHPHNFTIQYEVLDEINSIEKEILADLVVEKMDYISMRHCMTIILTPKFPITDSMNHILTFEFNSSMPKHEIPNVVIYLTSEYNMELLGTYFDGEPLIYKMSPNTYLKTEIKEKQIRYLQNGECRRVSFLEHLATHIKKSDMESCPRKCIPYYTKTGFKEIDNLIMDIPVCQTEIDMRCSIEWFYSLAKDAQKPCIKKEYSGRSHTSVTADDRTIKFSYSFSLPRTIIVYDEYLILDTIAMIGSIGGTLGLFIGFSFSNAFSYILSIVKSILIMRKRKRNNDIKVDELSDELKLTKTEILEIRKMLVSRKRANLQNNLNIEHVNDTI